MRHFHFFVCVTTSAVLVACTMPPEPSPAIELGLGKSEASLVSAISPSTLPYRFEVTWSGTVLTAIVVSRIEGHSPTVFQTITVPESNLYLPDAPQKRHDFLIVEDLNFDGFADIKLLGAYGAYAGTETYIVWFFNPVTRMFVHRPEFDAIVSPDVDQSTHHIHSYNCWRSLCDEHDFRSYDYQRGQLSLLREEKQELNDESSAEFVRTVTVRKTTGMAEICRLILKLNGTYRLLSGALQHCGALKQSATGEWLFTE